MENLERLWHIGNCVVPARTRPLNSMKFFKTRTGLCMYKDGFKSLILSVIRSNIALIRKKPLVYYDLIGLAADIHIVQELDGQHFFSPLNLLNYLASLIKVQWKGENNGPLLTNGYSNIFHARIDKRHEVVVSVWREDSKWYVHASHCAGLYWINGSRVFSNKLPV